VSCLPSCGDVMTISFNRRSDRLTAGRGLILRSINDAELRTRIVAQDVAVLWLFAANGCGAASHGAIDCGIQPEAFADVEVAPLVPPTRAVFRRLASSPRLTLPDLASPTAATCTPVQTVGGQPTWKSVPAAVWFVR